MYSADFTISTMPPTLNEIMSKGWRYRHNLFSKVHTEVRLLTMSKRPARPLQCVQVSLWRYSSGTLDRDNLYITFKPILDGLKECGVIRDDTFDIVRHLYPHQVKIKRGEPKRVRVLVEELRSDEAEGELLQ